MAQLKSTTINGGLTVNGYTRIPSIHVDEIVSDDTQLVLNAEEVYIVGDLTVAGTANFNNGINAKYIYMLNGTPTDRYLMSSTMSGNGMTTLTLNPGGALNFGTSQYIRSNASYETTFNVGGEQVFTNISMTGNNLILRSHRGINGYYVYPESSITLSGDGMTLYTFGSQLETGSMYLCPRYAAFNCANTDGIDEYQLPVVCAGIYKGSDDYGGISLHTDGPFWKFGSSDNYPDNPRGPDVPFAINIGPEFSSYYFDIYIYSVKDSAYAQVRLGTGRWYTFWRNSRSSTTTKKNYSPQDGFTLAIIPHGTTSKLQLYRGTRKDLTPGTTIFAYTTLTKPFYLNIATYGWEDPDTGIYNGLEYNYILNDNISTGYNYTGGQAVFRIYVKDSPVSIRKL